MKISVEQQGVTVSIEVDHDNQNMYEMVEHFKCALLALTYQEGSWKDVILTMADEYQEEEWYSMVKDYRENKEEENDDDTDNLPEGLPNSVHLGGADC